MTEPDSGTLRRSRLKLLAVMMSFGLPLIIATVIYYNPGLFSPSSSSHGVLLDPIRSLPDTPVSYTHLTLPTKA